MSFHSIPNCLISSYNRITSVLNDKSVVVLSDYAIIVNAKGFILS